MPREMSLRQYRSMDLLFFTVLSCLCETAIVLAATRWFPGEPYTLSLAPALTAIVMVRWGAWAAVPAVFGAMAFCLASGAKASQFLIYGAGNLLSLVLVLWLRRVSWQRLKQNVLLAMLYGLMTALLMQLGRAAIALAMGNHIGVCIGFFTTDVLSSFFAVLLVWVARRLDGMLEMQTDYIKRIQREVQEEKLGSGGMNG